MKYIFIFFILFGLWSCIGNNESKYKSDSEISGNTFDENNKSDKQDGIRKEIIDSVFFNWERHQDSLRNEIIKRKENTVLKESFLQEMYIRNVECSK